jgi:alpha-beta hydrolase superfamily lysophospholipase
VGSYLAEHGVSVFAYDHQGHGRSEGRRGWVEDFAHLLDDLETFHRLVRERSGSLPLVLLGHSMGGLIVTAYMLERPLKPDLLVLSGPAIVPILDPNDRTIDPTRLSKDPALWQAYLEDPLILRERVDPELFVRLAEGLRLLPGRASEIAVPVLLIHGDDDRLCSPEGAKMYVEGSASPDVTVKMYPGGRHEMFNETNRDEVLADLADWITARLA